MATNVLIEASDAAAILAGIGGSGQADLTQSPTPPNNPKAGDLWLDDSLGNGSIDWPLRLFLQGEWVQSGTYNPQDKSLKYNGNSNQTIVVDDEIQKSVSAPTSPAEGDMWWQPSGTVLVQHVYLEGSWQLTGASYDTAQGKYLPVTLGSGLAFDANGEIIVTGANAGTGLAAGDVVISLDDVVPSRLIELNGSIAAYGVKTYPKIAARYPWMVTGTAFIRFPDFRGLVPRGLDPLGIRDKEVLSRQPRSGDAAPGAKVGTHQSDAVGSHHHPVAVNYLTTNALGSAPNDLAVGQYNSTAGPISDGSTLTLENNGKDNRMANIAVRYCMVAG